MTIERAVKHFGFKLEPKNNIWKATEPDAIAYNTIIDYVQKKQKQQLIDNQLFGKLYIYLYGEFVNYYKTSASDKIPQIELNKLLCKDLRLIVKEVTDRLNYSTLNNVITEEDSMDNFEPIDYNEVAQNMRVLVNGAINEYTNN